VVVFSGGGASCGGAAAAGGGELAAGGFETADNNLPDDEDGCETFGGDTPTTALSEGTGLPEVEVAFDLLAGAFRRFWR
jgi:hypothetical protein